MLDAVVRKSFLLCLFAWPAGSFALSQTLPAVTGVEPQPLVAQSLRLMEALAALGGRLQPEDEEVLHSFRDRTPSPELVLAIQRVLDPYCLAMVEINPEARVKVLRGPAAPQLIEGGWKTFLVKVDNQAQVNAQLEVESPNGLPLLHRSSGRPRAQEENVLTPGQVANRFLELAMYRRRPLLPRLSGLKLEYAVLQIYSSVEGRREATVGFHIGQGTRDLGFRNAVPILFQVEPSVKVRLRVKDSDGSGTMASFTITDGVERHLLNPEVSSAAPDYRLVMARRQEWEPKGAAESSVPAKKLVGIYPLPSRRLARGAYPDFFFHSQIYRADNETVSLPPGTYRVEFTRGPEYIAQDTEIHIPEGVREHEVTFQLQRWIDMAELGWFSADHHVHAAGCSHYESPDQGVRPADMWRQALGEDLKVACVLTWGPCWYHQKQFFEGRDHSLSTDDYLMRYDVEVSGFPSSHAGHLVLLRLKEDDYPGTNGIQDWPSWTLPVLRWAKSQGGVTAYSHSGWGLEPEQPTQDLPNYVIPKFDGIGANEYVVTVTQDAVDFYSLGDTPWPWELNMWYHSLNVGFRTRVSGETDFPCIFDERVGMARTYARLEGPLHFDRYMEQIKAGRSYVSDGKSHIIDMRVNSVELGTQGSEVRLAGAQTVSVTARVAARLPEAQDALGAFIASRAPEQPPYWDLERARVGKSRRVPVELVVNGVGVARKEIEADGGWTDVRFEHSVERSSWIALRIFASAHTNPIFVLVDGRPIRDRESAQWCLRGVERCWEMKKGRIRTEEQPAAKDAYDRARDIYRRLMTQAPGGR